MEMSKRYALAKGAMFVYQIRQPQQEGVEIDTEIFTTVTRPRRFQIHVSAEPER